MNPDITSAQVIEGTEMVLVETKQCVQCGKTTLVGVTREQYDKILQRLKVQEVFPEDTSDFRELIITGTHSECWDKIFSGWGDEEE